MDANRQFNTLIERTSAKNEDARIESSVKASLCTRCQDNATSQCMKCGRCPSCYHRPWCDGEFVEVAKK